MAEWFIAQFRSGKSALELTPEAAAALLAYRWPGNVRELRNVVERAVILCQTNLLGLEHLPLSLVPQTTPARLGDPITLDRVEELHIRQILANTRSLDAAAQVLGIDSATLWRRRKRYGI